MFTSALRPFLSAHNRVRNRLILSAVCALTVIGASIAHAFLSVNTEYVRFSNRSDRSNSQNLGSRIIEGNVYIFLSYKDSNIASVTYYINPQGSLTRRYSYGTRTSAPYDLMGTNTLGQANVLDTRTLPVGNNLLVTKVVLKNGYTHHDFTWFTVGTDTNETIVTTTKPVATTTKPIETTTTSTTRPVTTTTTTRPATTEGQQVLSGNKCTLGLHGAGGGGGNYGPTQGVEALNPQARNPADGSSTNFWLYDGPHNFQNDPGNAADEQYYQYLVTYLRQTLDARGCGPTLITGSSSGGAFAAKLYCRGETFGNRVWGYTMEDPVKDEGVLGCRPSANVRIAFFAYSQEHERKSAAAAPTFRCSLPGSDHWYCENDKTMTLDEYRRQTGQPSLMTSYDHWSPNQANYLYRTSDGVNRYELLPWRFPAEMWRTCWDNGNCARDAFLP